MQFKNYITKRTAIAAALALTTFGGIVGIGIAYASNSHNAVLERVQKNFPNTKITSVSCNQPFKGLCEVVAGKNVFYTTPDGSYVVVGSVLDLNKKIDLTDRRLKELSGVDKTLAAINGLGGGTVETGTVPVQPVANPSPVAEQAGLPSVGIVNINLPAGNAIVHNPGAPIKISVFSDYNCHFCKALYDELINAPDIQVTEYPIAILGPESETKAKLVLCSEDRVKAAQSAFTGGQIVTKGPCDAGAAILKANGEFAQKHGITGTPAIIRADGQSQMGFKTLDALREFAKGAA